MTLNQALLTYQREHIAKLAPNTRRLYITIINGYIIPSLGLRDFYSITQRDIQNLHLEMINVPYLANRMLAMMSVLYKNVTPNPCKGIRRYNERSKENYMTAQEIQRLGVALAEHRDRPFVHAILLLLVTGARKREILNAEWKHVDWNKKQLKIPTSKTGKKHIILNDFAMMLLESIYSPGAKYIIPGSPRGKGPRYNIDKPWQALRAKLGMPNIRIHDLRHTFASITANAPGANIYVLRDLLHHVSVVTTEKYAHLFDETLREASNNAGKDLQALGLEFIFRPIPSSKKT